jgi:phosphoribosylformimino-5-aminoimidazole carboxamide ribotide isomerase
MQLIPAIDIKNGRCVRLFQGNFDRVTAYEASPIAMADRYRELGAEWLHIVDLDGAKSGSPQHLDLARQMGSGGGMKIQMGGGIRNTETLETALEVADRIVLGSLAVEEPELVAEWLRQYGNTRFTLGFDVRFDSDGVPRVTTHGWTRASALSLADVIEVYLPTGLLHVLCTDVDRDGALSGPNFALYSSCSRQWPSLAFQASGGVRHARDLEELATTGVAAAISGKALLEGRFTPEEIVRFLPNA